VREEGKEPQRAQAESESSHYGRLLDTLKPIPGAEPRADGEQSEGGRSVRGMEEDDGGEERRNK
jgi:hypothetical protein